MNAFVIPLIALLVLVFFVSAIGKLRAGDDGRETFSALRIPVRRPRIAAMILVLTELALALVLMLGSGWILVVGVWGATAFILALLAVVIRAHRLGSTADCGCFGEWLPSPVGAALIGRNVALALSSATLSVAVMTATIAGEKVGIEALAEPHLAGGDSVYWALTACVFVAGVIGATVHALKGRGSSPSAQTVDQGSGVVLVPDNGELIDLVAPGVRARLVVFLRAGCRSCIGIHDLLAAESSGIGAVADIYVVYQPSGGNLDGLHALSAPVGAVLVVDIAGSLARRLEVGPRRPAAVLVSPAGTVNVPVALGSENVSVLIGSLVAVSESTDAV